MTKREIAALICKALAIQTFIGAINLSPLLYGVIVQAFQTGIGGPMPTAPLTFTLLNLLLQMMPVVFTTLAGLYLWFRADDMAALMVKDSNLDTRTQTEPLVVGPEAQALVFAGLGVYSLTTSIPKLFQAIADYVYLTAQDPYLHPYSPQNTPLEQASVLVQVALGLWLLFGASGLVRLLASIRSASVDKRRHVEEDDDLPNP